MELKIDKGMMKSLKILAVVVAVLGLIYVALYIWGVIGGTIFYAVSNGTTYRNTVVTGESFTADNSTPQQLSHYPIKSNTLAIYNDSKAFGLGNFTIIYANASILLKGGVEVVNGTELSANYTYITETTNVIPTTADTRTYLSATEDDFFTNLGYVRSGVGIAMSLLTLVVILLLFAGIFKGSKSGKGKGDLSY